MLLYAATRAKRRHVTSLTSNFFACLTTVAFKFRDINGEGGLRIGTENPIIVALLYWLAYCYHCSLTYSLMKTSLKHAVGKFSFSSLSTKINLLWKDCWVSNKKIIGNLDLNNMGLFNYKYGVAVNCIRDTSFHIEKVT